jgi:DNA primase
MVSMPLDWSDLNASPERWTLTTVPQRLKRLRIDPWAKYWTGGQEISEASFTAVQGL